MKHESEHELEHEQATALTPAPVAAPPAVLNCETVKNSGQRRITPAESPTGPTSIPITAQISSSRTPSSASRA
jgi:hypothetical protein